jgi:hypothetical protein
LFSQLRAMISSMVRITVTPEWVGLLDFQTRFPSALASWPSCVPEPAWRPAPVVACYSDCTLQVVLLW